MSGGHEWLKKLQRDYGDNWEKYIFDKNTQIEAQV